MSSIKFFLCIFLVLSTFIDKTKPFKEKNGKLNVSFFETSPQTHSQEQLGNNTQEENQGNNPDNSSQKENPESNSSNIPQGGNQGIDLHSNTQEGIQESSVITKPIPLKERKSDTLNNIGHPGSYIPNNFYTYEGNNVKTQSQQEVDANSRTYTTHEGDLTKEEINGNHNGMEGSEMNAEKYLNASISGKGEPDMDPNKDESATEKKSEESKNEPNKNEGNGNQGLSTQGTDNNQSSSTGSTSTSSENESKSSEESQSDTGEEKKFEEKHESNSANNVSFPTNLHQIKGALLLDSFNGKGIHTSIRERTILEIMKCAEDGIKGLLRLKDIPNVSSVFAEALAKLNINEEQLVSNPNLLSLEMYDKILSSMFKIMTDMSFYESSHFYNSLGFDKSILEQSLKEIKTKILRKIGLTYSKLPPIIKNKGGLCPVKDFIVSITPRELSQRMGIMFTKWLSPEEYGSVIDFSQNLELNTLCAGASIFIQQWKYFQNILSFETDNDHAYLGLIDELLAIDKKYIKDEEYTKVLKKIKKSKAFNYCTKIMRIGGNISSVPFNHENVKKPSTSLVGSLGNLVKAHINTYYTAVAQRINSYFFYAQNKNKKSSNLKVISICTLLHITDILYKCSDEHEKDIFDYFNLQLNTLNIEGKEILQALVGLSFLNQENKINLKEFCEPYNKTVDETLTKLLVLVSTESHEILSSELEKRGIDDDYFKEEVKNINEEEENVGEQGEIDTEKLVFDDL